jgi:hypothetical protein
MNLRKKWIGLKRHILTFLWGLWPTYKGIHSHMWHMARTFRTPAYLKLESATTTHFITYVQIYQEAQSAWLHEDSFIGCTASLSTFFALSSFTTLPLISDNQTCNSRQQYGD